MRYRKSAHAIYKTEYHLVWIPRYRRKIFVKGVKEYTHKTLLYIPELDPDIEVIKVRVQLDHIHMVIVVPPRIAVADVVQFIKSQSAKKLKAKFPFLQKTYVSKEGIWSRGYCVSCIGLNEKEILAYVTYQEKEDKGQLQLTL
jgi:REP-associated tyrosine transposase